MIGMRRSALLLTTALVGFAYFGAASSAYAADPTYQFDIPTESLAKALNDFSQASAQQIIFSNETVAGRKSVGLHGSYTVAQALGALLAGTDLVVETNASGVLMVRPKKEQARDDQENQANGEVETVVVTGTNIRGGAVTGPVTEIDRKQIELGGFSTIGQALSSLPQNFGGGINIETTAVSGISQDNSNLNLGGASSVNLRGLGSNATLVLLDGHRLPTGGEGVSVDLSLIPLLAVSRVEVLADGSSAIYGTDAVAGVVNVITRRDFDGFDTSIRYDDVAGSGPNYQVAQLGGFNWSGGNLTLGYQYDDRSGLSVGARERTAEDTRPNYIYPAQTQNSGFLSASQQFTSQWSMFAEGIYSDRGNHYLGNTAPPPSGYQPYDRSTDSTGAAIAAGVDFTPGGDWLVEAFGTYARSALNDTDLSGTPPTPYDASFHSELASGELRASGNVLSLPGGELKSALGLSYRHEDFGTAVTGAPTVDLPRDIYAASAEFDLPIIGQGNELSWLKSADLVVAGRYEHYSDFGSTTNPKVGLAVSPLDGLELKGDYSTSFRAPEGFEETNSSAFNKFMFPAFDPSSPTGTTEELYLTGANPNLKPERAKNLTFTAQYDPPAVPGLSTTIDYYHIDFTNRILDPDPNVLGLFDITSPTIQGLVTRNPTPAQIQAAYSLPGQCADLTTGGACNPSSAMAIVDARDQNFAATRTSGLDFSASYAWDSRLGSWTASGTATYIINLDEQLSPTSPFQSLVNTIYNPVGFRGRAGLTWEKGSWSSAVYVNYVNGYQDNRNTADVVSIASWTTVALHFGYKLDDSFTVLGGGSTAFFVDVSNLFDTAPPFVAASPYGYTYDPTNASVLGRVVSLRLEKTW